MKKLHKYNLPLFLLYNVLLSVYSDFVLDDDIRARIIASETYKTTRQPADVYDQQDGQDAVIPFGEQLSRFVTRSDETAYQNYK